MGTAVVNVGYRPGGVALARAAVEDARCALRWVYGNAAEYGLDTSRIVVSGHLSLTTGVLPANAGLDTRCPNAKTYAIAWMGAQNDWQEISDRVSPINYVRPGIPPVLTLHGDADTIVPYEHATRLHAALKEQGVPEQLHTIDAGGHGGFSLEENIAAMTRIQRFLEAHGIL